MNPSDYTRIFFPFFGLNINPPRGIPAGDPMVNFYGLAIALGIVLAAIYGLKRKKQFGLSEDQILDGLLIIVPIAIICARLYYCIFSWKDYKDNLMSILYIWEGGLAIYGAVIGASISAFIYCRIRKIKITAGLDIMVLGFLIGQSVGRWGNFFNREAVGALAENSKWFLRMGLMNKYTGVYEYFHPTFLYESLWNLVGFIALHFLSKKRQYDGQIALGYVFWYGLGRTLIEGLRVDSLWWGPFRVSQLLAAITCFAAAIALDLLAFRKHDPAKLFVNQVAAREAAVTEEVPAEETPAEEVPAEEVPAEEAPAEEAPAEETPDEKAEETPDEKAEETAE